METFIFMHLSICNLNIESKFKCPGGCQGGGGEGGVVLRLQIDRLCISAYMYICSCINYSVLLWQKTIKQPDV